MKNKMSNINSEKAIRDEQYDSRKKAERKYQKKMMMRNGIFCLLFVGNFFVALCATNDMLRLTKTWKIVETSNPIVVFITALTCSMLLNVPMLYFGIRFKNYSQKLCGRSELVRVGCMAGATFIITYVFYFMFTMATRSSAYSIKSTSGFQLGGASNAADSSSSAILYIALYASFLPLATSIFSLLVGYCTSDPLEQEINIETLNVIDKQNNIMDIDQGIKEAGEPLKHADFLLKCEMDKYKTHIEYLNLQGLCMTIKTAEMIAKKIDTPEAYSELITVTKGYFDRYKYIEDMPHESVKILQKELIKEGLDDKIVNDVLNDEPKIA